MAPTAGMLRYNTDTTRLERSVDEGSNWNELDLNGAVLVGGATLQTTTSTGTQNNLSVTGCRHLYLRCNNASLLTITGFAPTATARNGDIIDVVAVNAEVDFSHNNASSSAANRLYNFVQNGPTQISPPGSSQAYARYIYDASSALWRIAEHEQGAWITAPYAAGWFTSSAGSWTSVTPTTFRYYLKGRTLSIEFYVTGSSVSGSPTWLGVQIPNSLKSVNDVRNTFYGNDGGGIRIGQLYSNAADSTILYCSAGSAVGVTAAFSGTTAIAFTITLEVY